MKFIILFGFAEKQTLLNEIDNCKSNISQVGRHTFSDDFFRYIFVRKGRGAVAAAVLRLVRNAILTQQTYFDL